ncbi:hypothetical protein ACBY01_13320 [Sphingomonas sp. ac-8]
MDIRSSGKRFMDSFAEEMGRWSARACAAGITLMLGLLLSSLAL